MFGYQAEQRKFNKVKGKDYLLFGLFGQVVGGMIAASSVDVSTGLFLGGELALVVSTGVLIGGCAKYARFYGLNGAWAVLGLFNLPGVMILAMLANLGGERKQGPGFGVIFAEPYRRDVWRMDVRVKLDERIGTGVHEPINLQLPRGTCVGNAMRTLSGVLPGLLEGDLPGVEFAINGQRVDRKAELADGDEMVVNKIGDGAESSGGIIASRA